MKDKDEKEKKIEFGESYKDFPKMTLLAMILVNERILEKIGDITDGEQLVKNFEDYQKSWLTNKEQENAGIWFLIHDGKNQLRDGVFKGGNVDILNNTNFNSGSDSSTTLGSVDWGQFQKDLKNGTTGNTPDVQFREKRSSDNATLAYIDFNSETS